MIKLLRRLYFKVFPTYKILETVWVNYSEGDKLLTESSGKPESERWQLSPLEDGNMCFTHVILCRKVRVVE